MLVAKTHSEIRRGANEETAPTRGCCYSKLPLLSQTGHLLSSPCYGFGYPFCTETPSHTVQGMRWTPFSGQKAVELSYSGGVWLKVRRRGAVGSNRKETASIFGSETEGSEWL